VAQAQPFPVFTPWDGKGIDIRHHEDRERIGRIRLFDGTWHLTWRYNRVRDSEHATGLEAVAAARDAYDEYLAVEYEATREFQEQQEYEERFIRQRAGAVARALRVPTGGQKGWRGKRSSAPKAE